MQWTKALLSLVVVLLYISLIFMGANVFFPDYTDNNYYRLDNCYSGEERTINETCYQEEETKQEAYNKERQSYEGQKYLFIVIVNLIVLSAAFFITGENSIIIGLFLGATLSSFFSTWVYFDSKSKIGFGVLVLIFFATIYFINKKKDSFKLK